MKINLNKKIKNRSIFLIIPLKALENFIETIIQTQNSKELAVVSEKLKSKNINKNLRIF